MMVRPRLWKAVALCAGVVLLGVALRWSIWETVLAPLPVDHRGGRWIASSYYPTWNRLDGLLFGMAFAAGRACRPAWWAALMRRANLLMGAGLAGMALSLWLFVDQRAELPSVIGYPILSQSAALLVASDSERDLRSHPQPVGVAARGRGRRAWRPDRPLACAGLGRAGRHGLQPLPQPQGRLSPDRPLVRQAPGGPGPAERRDLHRRLPALRRRAVPGRGAAVPETEGPLAEAVGRCHRRGAGRSARSSLKRGHYRSPHLLSRLAHDAACARTPVTPVTPPAPEPCDATRRLALHGHRLERRPAA